MSKALGLLEVFGFTTAVVIGDMIAKAADVKIVALDKNKPANGDAAEVPLLMTIKFEGDVADVEQALMVGVEEAKRRNLLVTYDLISRQAEDTKKMARIAATGKDKLNG
jgi:microcompartment protein CcmL/EutN